MGINATMGAVVALAARAMKKWARPTATDAGGDFLMLEDDEAA